MWKTSYPQRLYWLYDFGNLILMSKTKSSTVFFMTESILNIVRPCLVQFSFQLAPLIIVFTHALFLTKRTTQQHLRFISL